MKTNQFSAVKLLYRKWKCHYSARFTSMTVIELNWNNVAKFIDYETGSISATSSLSRKHVMIQLQSVQCWINSVQ